MQLDILLNGNPVDALAIIVHKDKAYLTGKRICEKLKEIIHRLVCNFCFINNKGLIKGGVGVMMNTS